MRGLTILGYLGVLWLLVTALLRQEISVVAFAAVFGSIAFMFDLMEEIICRNIGNMTRNLGTVRNFIRFLELPERNGEDTPVDPGEGVVA